MHPTMPRSTARHFYSCTGGVLAAIVRALLAWHRATIQLKGRHRKQGGERAGHHGERPEPKERQGVDACSRQGNTTARTSEGLAGSTIAKTSISITPATKKAGQAIHIRRCVHIVLFPCGVVLGRCEIQ